MATRFVGAPCDVTGLLRKFKCPGGGGGVGGLTRGLPGELMLKLRILYLPTLTCFASGLNHKSVQIVSLHMTHD